MRKSYQVAYKKIQLPFKLKRAVLALGAQAKNTLCFARGDSAYISRIHPDLSNPEDYFVFEKDAEVFLKKRPRIIACDLHPDYQSTRYAQEISTIHGPPSMIQHHHAHIASCMVENGLRNQKVIGVAFDGTGLGVDNTLWGAEFLLCDYKGFKRAAHLKEIPLLGGERAIMEPWRAAAAWLYFAYKDRFLKLGLKFTKGIDKNKWQVLKDMYSSGFNSPLTSSMGRLFDAAGAIILAQHRVNSEAELAVALERSAISYQLSAISYNFKVSNDNGVYIIDPSAMFKEMVSDLKAEEPKEKIAWRFHFTAAEMIAKTCSILRKNTGLKEIVLSGGVFQNTLLLRMSLDLLYSKGFDVFIHRELSNNDSCISLGQAVIAGF